MIDIALQLQRHGKDITEICAKGTGDGTTNWVKLRATVPVEITIFTNSKDEAERMADILNEIAGKTINEMAKGMSEETIKALSETTKNATSV